MCGITAIVRSGARPEAISRDLERMWPGIASRGPDGRGQYVGEGLGLGHARLAIIDLVTGDQPIWNEARTVGCVFNGEIYNYPRLRQELSERGHTLATTSDTEVLVHLYEDHGAALVDHIHGMYAFAIHDVERRRLLVARDRFGIKPLYFAEVNGGVAFASSIASLLALEDVSRDPDTDAVAEYFEFYKVGEPRTAFRAVRALLPGHLLEIDLRSGQRSSRRFYDPAVTAARPRVFASPVEAEHEARRRFEAAVASHLVADVEVGAFLSGGIDSTLVVAEAQRVASRPLRTFSVAFGTDPAFDESPYAERVARHLGTRHETLRVDDAPTNLLRDALRATGQPFAIASFLPLLLLCKSAASEVKVVLTGDGGDEVGMGYPWYRWMRWAAPENGIAHRLVVSEVLRRGERAASLHGWLRPVRRALKFARGAWVGGASASDAWRYDLPANEAADLLRSDLRPSRVPVSPTGAAWTESLSPVAALRLADIEVLLRDEMLPKLDRAGMAFGLEGRPPLIDDEFVEVMLAVPTEQHMTHPAGKALLRQWAVELCPVVDAARPKHGFDVPMHRWLHGGLASDARRLLLDPVRPGLTEPAAARSLWARMDAGTPGAGHTLFAMLLAELWFEQSCLATGF